MNEIPFLEQFITLSFNQLVVISLLLNLFLCFTSIIFYLLVHRFAKKGTLFAPYQPWNINDIMQVLCTIVCNAVVFVLGVYLWKYELLEVDFKAKWFTIFWQIVVLVLVMDLLMYVFHQIAHWSFFYKLVHRKHHDHVQVNALSLFVLSPFEAIGFGLFLIAVLGCFTFSYQAIIAYLGINLLWGTIGHFNTEFFPTFMRSRMGQWIGTARFHHTHHQSPNTNYGFYTTIWDKIGRTYKQHNKHI
jgi:sterol desaturase/sphingolipid hydroxylase (fatty acid hydroxylase superfamily)